MGSFQRFSKLKQNISKFIYNWSDDASSVLLVNGVNDQIIKWISPIPISWNGRLTKFEYIRKHQYFRTSAKIKLITALTLIVYASSVHLLPENVITIGLVANSLFLCTFNDYLVYKEGNSLVTSNNWILSTYAIKSSTAKSGSQRKIRVKCIFLSMIPIGTVFVGLCLGLTLTLSDLDPLYGLVLFVSPEVAQSTSIKIMRLPVNMYGFVYMHLTGQALFWIAILGDMLRCELISHLTTKSLKASSVMEYRRLQIVSIGMDSFERITSAYILLCLGALVVAAVPLTFIGIKLQNTSMMLLGGPATIMTVTALQIVFAAFILIHTKSGNVISFWKRNADAQIGKDRKYLQACVQALQPISVPVGKFGIFDEEIRANYATKLLGYCVDATLALNTIFTTCRGGVPV